MCNTYLKLIYSQYSGNSSHITSPPAKSLLYARFSSLSTGYNSQQQQKRADEIPPLIFINNDNNDEKQRPKKKQTKLSHNFRAAKNKIKFTSRRIKLYVFVGKCSTTSTTTTAAPNHRQLDFKISFSFFLSRSFRLYSGLCFTWNTIQICAYGNNPYLWFIIYYFCVYF